MNMKIEFPVIGIAILILAVSTAAEKRSTYIVHMAESEMPASFESDRAKWYESSLKSVTDTTTKRMLYTYNNVITGYAASLTPEQAQAMGARSDVLLMMPETMYDLHTTRTPWFLGLEQHAAVLPSPEHLSNITIGFIDTGVWPESKSFDDTGLSPIPSHWRGECETGKDFTKSMCNRKLVGARFFSRGYEAGIGGRVNESLESRSPRDNEGHGTHTSTTAAGSAVPGANLFGYANGTARGVAPQARVAMYKCCWKGGCASSDILAAMDKAIEDNVDVLSVSLGGGAGTAYSYDPVAKGAFAAMEKGILVSCSAGNDGPTASTISNTAPWITAVAAGTLDRGFPAPVTLGNGKTYFGVSLYSGQSLDGELFPFVYAGNATNDTDSGKFCSPGTLIPEKVKGKIVLCDRGWITQGPVKGDEVKAAGGVGTILANTALDGEDLEAEPHFNLTTAVGEIAGNAIKQYLFSDPNATATIFFQGTKLGVKLAPVVAAFSSRGPNDITPEILKPDLIAPGVNILAGWTGDAGPTGIDTDTRRVPYNIISGTSMACPHVSGLAAILKAAHPDWSPAAIRSALMTTAYTAYEDGNPILDVATGKPSTPYDHGAGHVNPLAALDPGLVYDLKKTDYLRYLCAINYTSNQIKALAGKTRFKCKKANIAYSVNYLNYPSFAVSIQANPKGKTIAVKHIRKLTNVGAAGTYKVKIISPSRSVKISVHPWKLTFNRTNDKQSYTVIFRVSPKMPANTKLFGRVEWHDGNNHIVGSPVAFSWTPEIK